MWLRTNDFRTYGGDPDKRNFQAQGVVDPTTDVSAEQFSRLVEDVAQLGRVTEFATLTFRCNDTSPAAPTILYYDALAGAQPTGARVSNGKVVFDWAASYTDAYGVSAQFHIAHSDASVQGTTAAFASSLPADINADTLNERVGVAAWDSAGAAVSDAVVTLTIWTSVI